MKHWDQFKQTLPRQVLKNKFALKIFFIHWSMKLKGLICYGVGNTFRNEGQDLADRDVAVALTDQMRSHGNHATNNKSWPNILGGLSCCAEGAYPNNLTPRTLIYRYPAEDDERYCLGWYVKNRGHNILVVLECTTHKECAYTLFDLKCVGNKDDKLDKLFDVLQDVLKSSRKPPF